MARLTCAEYQALRDKEDWAALWVAAIPWVKFAASSIRTDHKEDMIQSVLLDVGGAVPKWDPAKGNFPTYIRRVATRRMLNFVRDRALADGRQRPLHDFIDDDDEPSAHQERPQPTYADAGYAPEGFRSAEDELSREHAAESVEIFLAQLPVLLSLMVREAFGLPVLESHDDEMQVKDIAAERGIPRQTLGHQLERARKTMSANHRAVYVKVTAPLYPPEGKVSWRTHLPASRIPGFWDMGVASVMGDTDAWRESTGAVHGDWAWKPTDTDVMRGAKR